MKRNAWETESPFVQCVEASGKVYLRTYQRTGEAPLVVELNVSEAVGLVIDRTNKARVIVERGRHHD